MVLTQATPIAKRFMDAIQSCGLAVVDSRALTGGFHARHGDWAMRVRFWREITRAIAEKCAECFLRAPFAPKPGHMTQSPCLKVVRPHTI
ncbi:MAG: hypothetical protein A2535_11615 [Burkholderiales bacterium RIFOXYD2_FULL_59_8]|nr:MAG: hypothetical protein A2503_15705 [Burkholderiales bacterium RIFOXYD12_FULL_59_19]OGB67447.1 MAG: hypothetical protein A2496_23135 [Burkholderiales bacterium RIFOXYC12_FULL_60_6]OGB82983.1 MAG: hypothetical protein A2535_11615 [Burkholderiales bacterium RIFOXYD2_FULL_59_8]